VSPLKEASVVSGFQWGQWFSGLAEEEVGMVERTKRARRLRPLRGNDVTDFWAWFIQGENTLTNCPLLPPDL